MAGPVGNYLYGYLAGGRLRLHPVPSLLAYVGGLAVFGVSGMVLGPVVLAVTLALVEMWQRRAGSTAAPVEGPPAAVDESAHQPALG
jgi:predicted PurR-regulated permease PerM